MFSLTARRVVGALLAAGTLALTQLGAAPAAQADADSDAYCYTTRSSGDPFYNGPSASKVYDADFRLGVKIPDGLLDPGYVPQGIASWSNWNGTGEDVLLISAYKDSNGNGDLDGPSGIWGVVASGSRHGLALGRMLVAQGHVGGVGVFGGWLYVGSGSEIRGYRLSTVRGALAGANTDHVYAREYNRPSSYPVSFMGTGDGHLWAGTFSETQSTRLNGYVQTSSSTGALSYVPSTQVYAPKKTQGVTVTPSYVVFSTSYGRNDRGNIWVMRRGQQSLSDANSYCFRAPSMNEGITQLNGRLYLNFESGAYAYNKGLDDPDNPVTWVHSASTSEVTSRFTRGPGD